MKKVMYLAVVMVVALMVFAPAPAAAEDSAALWKGKCAMCHAADGSGNTPMGKKFNLKDMRSAEVQKMSDAQLTEITAKGKDKMPAYEKKLSADQIKQLVAYIRELAKK